MIPFASQLPKDLSDFVGQEKSIKSMQEFFETFSKGKALLLHGPPGTGKTSCVQVFAKEKGYDLLELNASDARNKKSLEEFLSKATGQMSLFGTKKIILIDEIDGVSGTKDRGAIPTIVATIKKSQFPIVITGSNVFDKKFSPLRKVCKLITFDALSSQNIQKVLELKSQQLTTPINEQIIKHIAFRCGGDARAALTDLFCAALTQEQTTELADRRQTVDIEAALLRVFKTTQAEMSLGAFDLVDENIDKIFLWLDENIPREYTSPKDITIAYEKLALADVFFGRIRRWQYYRFYVYCYVCLTAGISLAKEKKYSHATNYKQPSRLLKYWQANITYAKRKAIVEKIAQAQRISKNTALQSSLYQLLPVLANDKKVQEELELTSDEISWLQKQTENII